MAEEVTVEIEPWEDYLELEVGPILKYMQYPSFESDDETFEDEVYSEIDEKQDSECENYTEKLGEAAINFKENYDEKEVFKQEITEEFTEESEQRHCPAIIFEGMVMETVLMIMWSMN